MKVVFDFKASQPGEMSVKEGQSVTTLADLGDWKKVKRGEDIGLVPASFLSRGGDASATSVSAHPAVRAMLADELKFTAALNDVQTFLIAPIYYRYCTMLWRSF